MAWIEKYNINFSDNKNIAWYIKIYKEDDYIPTPGAPEIITLLKNINHPDVTFSGTSVTRALIAADTGFKYYASNPFPVKTGDKFYISFNLSLTSGTPRVCGMIPAVGGGWISNYITMVDGANSGVLTATEDNTAEIWFEGKQVADYSTGPISLKKVQSEELTAAGNPLIFNYTNEGDDIFSSFRDVKATINIVQPSNFYLKDVYSLDDMTYKVDIYHNDTSTLFYTGYIDTQNYQEEYDNAPNIVSINCGTGLGLLESIEFKDSSLIYYKDRTLESEIILNILNKIGYTEFKEFINIYENGISSSTFSSPFDQIYIDSEVFKDKVCSDVLIEILKTYNATITQKNGIFTIYRPIDTFNNTTKGRHFTDISTNTYITKDNIHYLNRDISTSVFQHLSGSGLMRINPPTNEVELLQDYNNKESLLQNYELDAATYDGSTFEYWTNTNSTVIKNAAYWKPDEVYGIGVKGHAIVFNASDYITTTFGNDLSYTTTDILSVEIDYLLLNETTTTATGVSWSYRISDLTGTYYLGTSSLGNNFAEWTTTPSYRNMFYPNELSNEVKSGNTGWLKHSLNIIGLPTVFNTKYKFTLYKPYGVYGVNVVGLIKNIKFVSSSGKIQEQNIKRKFKERKPEGWLWHSGWGLKPKRETISTFERDEIIGNSYYPDVSVFSGKNISYEYMIGDVIDTSIDNVSAQFKGAKSFYNAKTFYPPGWGTFITSVHQHTDSWNCNWDLSIGLLNMLGDEIKRQYNYPTQFLHLPFIETGDSSIQFNILGCLKDEKNDSTPFAMNRGSLNAKDRIWNLDLTEIVPYTPITRTYSFSASPTDVSFGGNGDPSTQIIDLSTNVGYTYSISPAADWLGASFYNHQIELNASLNTGAARDTSIYLYPEESLATVVVAVHQDASLSDSVDIDAYALEFDGDGNPYTTNIISVTSSGTWNTSLVDNGDGTAWISTFPTSGSTGQTTAVTVDSGYVGLGRTAIVRFTVGTDHKDCYVTQYGSV